MKRSEDVRGEPFDHLSSLAVEVGFEPADHPPAVVEEDEQGDVDEQQDEVVKQCDS